MKTMMTLVLKMIEMTLVHKTVTGTVVKIKTVREGSYPRRNRKQLNQYAQNINFMRVKFC